MIDYAFCKMRVLWFAEENEYKDKPNHESMFLLENPSFFSGDCENLWALCIIVCILSTLINY